MNPSLPSRPTATYLFDGDCALCSGGVTFATRWGAGRTLRFVPASSEQGRALCLENGIDPELPMDVVYVSGGAAIKGSDAVLAIASHMKSPARWLGALAVVPRPIREWAYRIIARNRYSIFGRTTCAIPTGPRT